MKFDYTLQKKNLKPNSLKIFNNINADLKKIMIE